MLIENKTKVSESYTDYLAISTSLGTHVPVLHRVSVSYFYHNPTKQVNTTKRQS